LRLFEELIALKKGQVAAYQKAHALILDWMKKYPLKTNKWGPFFEDIEGWSDTQINAMTFARYMMENPQRFPNWQKETTGIFQWAYQTLGNKQWEKYGVIVMNEQTAYQTPGNSHSARQAADELLYAALSGDESRSENAIRMLHWATYMVDVDGKNNYPRDEVWLTDGYGDYVRHYLRAMAAQPDLAPAHQTHLLYSSVPLTQVDYAPHFNKTLSENVDETEKGRILLYYRTYHAKGEQHIRMPAQPSQVKMDGKLLAQKQELEDEGFTWTPLRLGGVLKIRHEKGQEITIYH
jgi:hypothetical protein